MDMRVTPRVKQKLVMIGNGMAGVRTLEELFLAPNHTPTTTASCSRQSWLASKRSMKSS